MERWQAPHITHCDLTQDGVVVAFADGHSVCFAHETLYSLIDYAKPVDDINDAALGEAEDEQAR